MEDNLPKVSVVVPSYNRAEYIPATLDSILNQTFTDFEIVFVDDGSTDNTKEIVESYSKKDSRLKYFYQDNSERAVARSNGISKSRGSLVCLVDSDDLWYPEKLEKQVEIMEKNKEVVLCYASVNRIDFDGNAVKSAKRQHEGFSGSVYSQLLKRNFIPSVTPMIRKDVLNKVGEQVHDFIPYEDWDFWLRISREGSFYHIKEPLGDYRLHPGQSVQNVNAEKIEEVTLKVLDANTSKDVLNGTYESYKSDIKEAYSLANLRFAYWYIMAAKPDIARERLCKANRKLDYRSFGLFLASINPSFFKSLLASFH